MKRPGWSVCDDLSGYDRYGKGADVPADFSDRTDFDNANRGLVARLEPGVIKAADGRVVYDADLYTAATTGDCPDTVHPSLWRQSRLTAIQGLFEVTGGASTSYAASTCRT
nr:hypothetical protein GCM10020092_056530 [Actinoplanes digitatis]